MAVTLKSIRLDTHLADEAAKVLGVKSRTESRPCRAPGDRCAEALQKVNEEERGKTFVRRSR